jgi:hypothetical protein
MKTTLAILAFMTAARFEDRLELGYAALQGSERQALRAVFSGRDGVGSVAFHSPGGSHVLEADGRSPVGMGFEGLASQVHPLPLWLPAAQRRIGTVIYDDGRGFMHDRGTLAYVLTSKERWQGFDAVVLSYGYQGMQEQDNWRLEARYDVASGYLLSAFVETRLGAESQTTFKLVLATSSDAAMKKKFL